jgi:UDP-glucose:(galactosyl)LPS alpha-1,2-glucosyltransferase
MNEQVYHFGFGVDANYVKYAGVLMTNLVLRHPGQQLHFHLACDGIDETDKRRLEEFVQKYRNVKVDVYDLRRQLDALKPIRSTAPSRLNRSVLLRILLPSLVPLEAKRLVYMDVDVICCRRLDELFALDLQGQAIAAVRDTKSSENAAALGLAGGKYCFAGVLVINVVYWRQQCLTEHIVSYYQQYSDKLLLLEQDALNAVINGGFTELDKRYNFLIEVNNPLMCAYPEDVAILHCVNEAKAWTKGCVPQIYDLYWQYVRQSPWHDLQPVEPNTAKAVFLAATTAELQGDYEQARKYYVAVINRFTEYYNNKAPQLLQEVRRECLAAVTAERQGDNAVAVRCYGLAARRLTEQYLRDDPGLVDS